MCGFLAQGVLSLGVCWLVVVSISCGGLLTRCEGMTLHAPVARLNILQISTKHD